MNNSNEIFQSLKIELLSNSDNAIRLPELDDGNDDFEKARAEVLYRFSTVYSEFMENKAGYSDLLILLRQIIRIFGPICLRKFLWEKLRTYAVNYRLIEENVDGNIVRVIADDWKAAWLAGSEKIDVFELRRKNEVVPGDGLINAMNTSWTTYRSEAQKVAVDTWLFAAPGSTTLVTLPTGEGKSLCTILPPWFDAQGGASAKGTTLVIVPTVALAHDQQKQAQQFFPNARGEFFEPWSRTGETSTEVRSEIERAIIDGTLPVLFTSPESLIQSRLYWICLQAARAGHITRLVIDEAHLVETWGAGFRIEFQLLATYRRMLLKESKGRLKTLLLSATVTNSGFDVLTKLFSEEENLITVQANRLRSEIEYYFDYSFSKIKREKKILDALRILPRPLILYVTQPRQAEEWKKLLRKENYCRVQAFHGETPNSERQKLIRDWDENRIDIMVATSAFGLGVDKKNVRSVVHATVPENIDRLYQEVGRGGRDGCRSISLVSVIDTDRELASALLPKRLTVELAYQRWCAMTETAKSHSEKEGIILIDRDATRKDAPKMRSGDTNREWNFHMLLLMQRAGMIEITEVPPEKSEEETNWLPIKLITPEIFLEESKFRAAFEHIREDEQIEINKNRDQIFNLVKEYALGDCPEKCLAAIIGRAYERAQLVCSGCPTCRQSQKYLFTADKTNYYIDYPVNLARSIKSKVDLDEDIRNNKMGGWRQFNLVWDGMQSIKSLRGHLDEIATIFWKGFEQIIYPKELLTEPSMRDAFIRKLANSVAFGRDPFIHRLIPLHLIINGHVPIFPLSTLVIYPLDDKMARKLYQKIVSARNCDLNIPYVLNIFHENQQFDDGKKLLDVLDGINEPIQLFISAENGKVEDDIPLF